MRRDEVQSFGPMAYARHTVPVNAVLVRNVFVSGMDLVRH